MGVARLAVNKNYTEILGQSFSLNIVIQTLACSAS